MKGNHGVWRGVLRELTIQTLNQIVLELKVDFNGLPNNLFINLSFSQRAWQKYIQVRILRNAKFMCKSSMETL